MDAFIERIQSSVYFSLDGVKVIDTLLQGIDGHTRLTQDVPAVDQITSLLYKLDDMEAKFRLHYF